jgi:hypothetical protein
MRVLLDECVPVQVAAALSAHRVSTVTGLRWKGLENGELLRSAEAAGFDVLVIADKNLRYQQNLKDRHSAIVEPWTNHRPTLEKYFPLISAAVDSAGPGDYIMVTPPTITL